MIGWMRKVLFGSAVPSSKPYGPKTILIPAGEFLMGSDPRKDKMARNNEQPQHSLYLPDDYLAETPVTNAQYGDFIQATGHTKPKHWKGGTPPRFKKNHPVVNVSWHDAITYCRWLSEVTGKPYCLPSEAEWEKGARGTDGRIYPWGSRWDWKRCDTPEDNTDDTTRVGAYPQGASPYGLLDMAGNVCEWTRSLWAEDWGWPDDWERASLKYPYDPDDGREDLESEGIRALRGVSWRIVGIERYARCARRYGDHPSAFDDISGFRVAVSPALSP